MERIVVKKFDELEINEIYDILKLRNEVFVVEQNCPYLDTDDNDQESVHFMLKKENKIIAYLRVLPKGITYETVAIGRVAVTFEERGKSYASFLLKESINYITKILKEEKIMLGAQVYTLSLYEKLGFKIVSSEYLEDNIPHVDMLYIYE